MEQHLQITQLLDQQISPAFLVEDHIIICECSRAAAWDLSQHPN